MAFVEQDKEKTFTMVFDKNYEALCLYAVKFTEDFLEAEDIVQEAFVRFWEMYRDRLTTENARPLLYRMTRNMLRSVSMKKNTRMWQRKCKSLLILLRPNWRGL